MARGHCHSHKTFLAVRRAEATQTTFAPRTHAHNRHAHAHSLTQLKAQGSHANARPLLVGSLAARIFFLLRSARAASCCCFCCCCSEPRDLGLACLAALALVLHRHSGRPEQTGSTSCTCVNVCVSQTCPFISPDLRLVSVFFLSPSSSFTPAPPPSSLSRSVLSPQVASGRHHHSSATVLIQPGLDSVGPLRAIFRSACFRLNNNRRRLPISFERVLAPVQPSSRRNCKGQRPSLREASIPASARNSPSWS